MIKTDFIKPTRELHLDSGRITALWGFSEAAFGGILHALNIPFTGMFVGGAAVIFITLIAHFSEKKSTILQATFIVILVKAVVSPYSPLTAYFAVSLQGILGYLFFSIIKFQRIASILLGFFSLLFAALQKLIVLTLLFGTGLWKSINLFIEFVLAQFQITGYLLPINFSWMLILIYIFIHLTAGIFVGFNGASIPRWIYIKSESFAQTMFFFQNSDDFFSKKKKGRRMPWWKRTSGIIVLIFLIGLMILSYLNPNLGTNHAYEILLILLRSFLITFFWFSIFSPIVIKWFNKFLEKNKFRHASEINSITVLFPSFRRIINFCWENSYSLSGVKRIRKFLLDSFALLLLAEL